MSESSEVYYTKVCIRHFFWGNESFELEWQYMKVGNGEIFPVLWIPVLKF